MKKIEEIAFEEFKNVGDDGLFPNHTDKDIWIAGFKAGYSYFKTHCEKSPTGKHVWIENHKSAFGITQNYCEYCHKT